MSAKKPVEGDRGVEGRIGYLLRQARHAVRLKIDRSISKHGVTHPQYAVLKKIELEPGSHAADIARACMRSPQAVNGIINNLEAAGLIKRKPHKVHGKVLEIYLTDLGHKRLEQCKKIVHAIEDELMEGLKPDEEKIIRNWLVRCAQEQ